MHLVAEDAVLRQRDRVREHAPDDGAANHGQRGVRQLRAGRIDGFDIALRRIEDAVADPDRHGILGHLVLNHANRADDAVLDQDAAGPVRRIRGRSGLRCGPVATGDRADVVERDARLRWAGAARSRGGSAPPGHERAVADR